MKKKNTIYLIHPSRGRPDMAKKTIDLWYERADNKKGTEIRHILSLDEDDPSLGKYKRKNHKVVGPGEGMVAAVNRAFIRCKKKESLVVVMSDDFEPPKGWDSKLLWVWEENPGAVIFVKCELLGQNFQTIQIADRRVFERWGYVLYPGYYSMFSDNDFTAHAMSDGIVVDCHSYLDFKHHHPMVNGGELDETYKLTNHGLHMEEGERTFEARTKREFQS